MLTRLLPFAILSLNVFGYGVAATNAEQSVNNDDIVFVQRVASGGNAEVELSRVAISRSNTPNIKVFAQ